MTPCLTFHQIGMVIRVSANRHHGRQQEATGKAEAQANKETPQECHLLISFPPSFTGPLQSRHDLKYAPYSVMYGFLSFCLAALRCWQMWGESLQLNVGQ